MIDDDALKNLSESVPVPDLGLHLRPTNEGKFDHNGYSPGEKEVEKQSLRFRTGKTRSW